MRTAVVVVAMTLLMGGACSSGGDTRVCTKAGCTDGVTYLIDDAMAEGWPRPLTIRVCVDDQCSVKQVPVGKDINRWHTQLTLPPDTLDREALHTASIRVVDEHGEVLLERSDTVSLTTSTPNGVECGPICGQGGVEVTE